MKQKKERPRLRRLIFTLSLVVFVIQLINFLIFGGVLIFLAESGRLGEVNSFNRALPLLFAAVTSLPVGTLLAMVMVRIPLRGVNALVHSMERLADGHFDERISLGSGPQERRIADSFNTLAGELQNTEMLRSDFINNFSHEFKTPIVSISGFAKILEHGGLPPEEEREYLHIIASESARLASMATNVLNLTKVENQNILTNVTEFNVSEQLRKCILLLEKRWTAKNLDIVADFGEHKVRGNEELLKQVWVNLLDNAVKFSPEGGALMTSIRESDGQLRVEIANEGPQIAPEAMKHIFEKFYQGDTSHASEGTGIGLSIVKKIVSLHKGEVTVSSTPSRTAFTVTLPGA